MRRRRRHRRASADDERRHRHRHRPAMRSRPWTIIRGRDEQRRHQHRQFGQLQIGGFTDDIDGLDVVTSGDINFSDSAASSSATRAAEESDRRRNVRQHDPDLDRRRFRHLASNNALSIFAKRGNTPECGPRRFVRRWAEPITTTTSSPRPHHDQCRPGLSARRLCQGHFGRVHRDHRRPRRHQCRTQHLLLDDTGTNAEQAVRGIPGNVTSSPPAPAAC